MSWSYDWLAQGAASCWALNRVLLAPLARHLGAIASTRWRMLLVFYMLLPVVLFTGSWHSMTLAQAAAPAAFCALRMAFF